MSKVKYDSTVARIAGNLLSGHWRSASATATPEYAAAARATVAAEAVALARAIVAEVQRTEPAVAPDLCGNKVGKGICTQPQCHTGLCIAKDAF